jgi:hypothetical protein
MSLFSALLYSKIKLAQFSSGEKKLALELNNYHLCRTTNGT